MSFQNYKGCHCSKEEKKTKRIRHTSARKRGGIPDHERRRSWSRSVCVAERISLNLSSLVFVFPIGSSLVGEEEVSGIGESTGVVCVVWSSNCGRDTSFDSSRTLFSGLFLLCVFLNSSFDIKKKKKEKLTVDVWQLQPHQEQSPSLFFSFRQKVRCSCKNNTFCFTNFWKHLFDVQKRNIFSTFKKMEVLFAFLLFIIYLFSIDPKTILESNSHY